MDQMLLTNNICDFHLDLRFENGVILHGNKTAAHDVSVVPSFENGVILHGNKTLTGCCPFHPEFENGVILHGNKTDRS